MSENTEHKITLKNTSGNIIIHHPSVGGKSGTSYFRVGEGETVEINLRRMFNFPASKREECDKLRDAVYHAIGRLRTHVQHHSEKHALDGYKNVGHTMEAIEILEQALRSTNGQ